jgi:hypothetical protein
MHIATGWAFVFWGAGISVYGLHRYDTHDVMGRHLIDAINSAFNLKVANVLIQIMYGKNPN